MRNPTIYHYQLGYGRNSGWYETYTHFSHQHQLLLQNFKRKSGWSIETFIHLNHCHQFDHHYDKLHNYKEENGWSHETCIHLYHFHHYDKLHDYDRYSSWYQDTYFHVFYNTRRQSKTFIIRNTTRIAMGGGIMA